MTSIFKNHTVPSQGSTCYHSRINKATGLQNGGHSNPAEVELLKKKIKLPLSYLCRRTANTRD